MRNGKFLILILLLSANHLVAQDITGLWKGTLYNDTNKLTYQYEIGISEEKGKLTGFSHTWFILEDKQYYGVKKVKINRKDGKYIIVDDELISNNYPVKPAKGVKQLNVLTLEIRDSVMFLTGPFSTNAIKEYRSLTGTISVQRRNDFWQSALVPHLQELGKAEDLSFVQEEIKVIAKAEADKKEEVAAIAKKEEQQKEQNAAIAKLEADRLEKESQEAALASVAVNRKDIRTEKVMVKKSETELKSPEKVKKKVVPVEVESETVKTEIVKEAPVNNREAKVETIPIPDKKKPEVKPVPEIVKAAAHVSTRNTELQQTVYFKTDSLQLSLYDNGEVDGDTVSVLMNGKIIFEKERLSTKAVRKTIAIDPNQDSIQLVMYAENLGTIAPNTGLLVVKDGKDIYEIRFSGDLKKNAAIVFRRKK